MKIEIQGRPVFQFELTHHQATQIKHCAINHYDQTCRYAGIVGGFVYGWVNATSFSEPCTVSATFRDLDLTCKILEGGELLGFDEATTLRQAFAKAMQMANKASLSWETTIETNEPHTHTHQPR